MRPKRIHTSLIPSIILLVFLLCSSMVFAENMDPDDDGFQYAWGENVGWINLEPGGDGGSGVEVADFDLTGYMWGENIGWISMYPSEGGVANDGDGNLMGYAWAENVGWISFSCGNTGTCATADYSVVIDPDTGIFGGYAWGENIGWINFAPTEGGVETSWRGNCTDADADGYAVQGGECGTVDCDDANPITYPGAAELCDGEDNDCNGSTDDEPAASANCDDGLFCNGVETCTSGNCVSPGNPCVGDPGCIICLETLDVCDATTDPCDDGLWCNGTDTCSGGTCSAHAGDPCDGFVYCCEDGEYCSDDPCGCQDLDGDGFYAIDPVNCHEGDDCDDDNTYDPPLCITCDCEEEGCSLCARCIYPGAEDVCDGVDNDCDPVTGDGKGEDWLGAPCDGPDSDLCEEGSYDCIGGAQSCSDDTGDDLEVCDGADNDCDGQTDEEIVPIPCPLQDGVCVGAQQECVEGGWTACDYGPDYEETEATCDDGLDNDCDSQTDMDDPDCETCWDNDGDSYDDEACGGDDCDDGNPNVHPGMQGQDCSDPSQGGQPGVDDDCDGQVDEDNCGGSSLAYGPQGNARTLGFVFMILIPMIFVFGWKGSIKRR